MEAFNSGLLAKQAECGMQTGGIEVSKEQQEASVTFGKLVHFAAVRSGGKSEIARRLGVDREVIRLVTTGYAFSQERETLLQLASVIRPGELGTEDLKRLKFLIPTIKRDS